MVIHYDLVLHSYIQLFYLSLVQYIVHGFIYLFTENPLPTSSLFCLLSPTHLCCMLTFPLPFKSVITNMWHGFDIICFNDCILDLIPLALAYTIQGFP